MEALHYYSAIFDKNIVSCEGPARVERNERVDQWRRRRSRAGFQVAPIKMMAQAKQWLVKSKVCDDYTVVEEKGCFLLEMPKKWQPIILQFLNTIGPGFMRPLVAV
ncbi:Scarecrow-like protein 3 [Populus alba x Populus x berolinensis]|uniref:Scarecrow-like protein 3 n=2 Tax=Populus TaxID=3689 RepID=A0AAD6M2R5_9ROSI|nr:Scarecrow-like protein 3 [Populus alba x Populus x berolinensis]